MNVVDLIERKRDGGTLQDDEIRWLIAAYTSDDVADYQMAAMLMAVFLQGLESRELAAWTDAMLHSGSVLDLAAMPGKKVDKHSTGGVGDKVSIPLAPLVAACGVIVPMISGRGLGHTGGTLDKMESIPGFSTALEANDFFTVIETAGFAMAGQTESVAPADRKMYALRDVTGTVPSIPLISASIMSKKLAEDLDGLLLDVKTGTGAFMTDRDQARTLAKTMVGIGEAHGTDVVAYLTDMNQPLGDEIGNASEIRESIAVLQGTGPADLTEIVELFGGEMLRLGGVAATTDDGRAAIRDAVASGAGLKAFAAMVEAQGGNSAILTNPGLLAIADHRHEFTADRSGVVARAEARALGTAAMRLGAGREKTDDTIDPGVGLTMRVNVGDPVEAGDPLVTVWHRDDGTLQEALALIDTAFVVADEAEALPLVYERIE